MDDSNSEPPRCRCGFWGSVQTMGLCSKCFKETNQSSVTASNIGIDGTSLSSNDLTKALDHLKSDSSQHLVAVTEISTSAKAEKNGEDSVRNEAECKENRLVGTIQEINEKTAAEEKVPSPGTKRERQDSELSEDSEKPSQKNKKRCFKCQCKLELAIREIGRCRCDFVFCQLHRLPEQHDCCFDHKEKGRQEARDKMISPKKHMGNALKRIDSDT